MELRGAAGIHVSGTSRVSEGGGFRIDHITFEYIGWERPLKITGRTYGVLDHNFGGSDGPAFAIIRETIDVENGIDGGNFAWHNNSDGFGSIDAVYFEDNNFTLLPAGERSGMVFDGDSGSKIVARHNIFNNYYIGGHDVSSIGDSRSALYYEIYENELNTTFSYGSALISLRGGTSRVFNNKIIANNPVGEPPFYLTEQDNPGGISMTNYRSAGLASVEPWNNICGQTNDIKACTGRINGDARACVNDSECGDVPQSCEAIDGPIVNNIEGAGYPCRDQIGRGINHELVPALFWNNTLKIRDAGANNVIPLVYVDAQQHIGIDRDFCHSIDVMPTSCGGVATTYTPLVYPHPLIQDVIFIDGFETQDT